MFYVTYLAPKPPPCSKERALMDDSARTDDAPTAVVAISHLLSTLATASAKGARRRLAKRDRIGAVLHDYVE
jgi:hypothetical protein